jgi:hypothetical protein
VSLALESFHMNVKYESYYISDDKFGNFRKILTRRHEKIWLKNQISIQENGRVIGSRLDLIR